MNAGSSQNAERIPIRRTGILPVSNISPADPWNPVKVVSCFLGPSETFWELIRPTSHRVPPVHPSFDVRCSSSGLCGKSSIPNDSTLFGGAPRWFFLFRAPNSAFRVQKNYQTNPSWIFRFACKQRGFSTKCLKPRKKRTHFPREKPIRNHIQTAVCRRPIKFS